MLFKLGTRKFMFHSSSSINVPSMFPAMASHVRPIRTSLHPSGLSPNPPRKARPNPLAVYRRGLGWLGVISMAAIAML